MSDIKKSLNDAVDWAFVFDTIFGEGFGIENITDFTKHYESLVEQNKILKDALEFYADKDNWFDRGGRFELQDWHGIHSDDWEVEGFDVYGDELTKGGKRARQALKKCEGLSNEF